MNRPLISDDFEEVPLPSNVVSIEGFTATPASIFENESLTFDEIFKKLIEGEQVSLKFKHAGEYNSLRASLLRRYKSYLEIRMVLGRTDNTFLQCSSKGIVAPGNKNVTGYNCTFKVQPLDKKKNGNTKKYELLKDL